MSTIATKLSAAKLQVGTAAVATVLAAATLTPAIADAAPSVSFAPFAQVGSSITSQIVEPIIPGTPGANKSTAAADEVGVFAVDPITGLVQFVGQIIVNSLSFVSQIIYDTGKFVYSAAVAVAHLFGLPTPPPPYSGV